MSKRIYFAAPIHQLEDAQLNDAVIYQLRKEGFDVWAPQEAGIASDVAKQTGQDLAAVRAAFLKKDLSAMKTCDICVAYIGRDRKLSEGMLWEMGWFTGMNKLVIFYNPHHVKTTLMAEFSADFIVASLGDLLKVLQNV
jgi:nucleoside 2-deoxyribosyltransferase